jgi:DNA-binding CsgD family transcriptional regulator
MLQHIEILGDRPHAPDGPGAHPFWDDVAELAEAVMTSPSTPEGFVRREMPIGDVRANVYAGLSGRDGTRPAAIVVVIAPPPSTAPTARSGAAPGRGELRRRFGLTPREAQVALLLAARRSNKEIAMQLSIAQKTAARHTESVMAKLNTNSRRDVARILGWHPRTGETGRHAQRERTRWRG